MGMATSQIGKQQVQNYSKEQLELLLQEAALSGSVTHETAALTLSELWEMATRTQNTLDQATIWTSTLEFLSKLGLTRNEYLRGLRYAIHMAYPEHDWDVQVDDRGGIRLQAKMRLE